MIVLTASKFPDDTTSPFVTGPPDDDRRKADEERRMNIAIRELRDVKRRLDRLLVFMARDTIAPVDPENWR